MSDSGLLSHASVLKRDRKGDLRNGMVRMANPPPKATVESFCFLLFLLGVRRAYFGLGYQRDKGSKKLQVFTPQPTGMGSCPFQGWWDTWEHTQEPPDLSHMGPKEQQIPSLQPWGRAQGMALGGDSCWAGPGHRNPHQVSSCPSPSGHSYSNSYTSPLLCHKCHSEDTLSA